MREETDQGALGERQRERASIDPSQEDLSPHKDI